MHCLRFGFHIYELFGFEPRLELSTRPQKRIGSDEMWDRAEAALRGGAASGGPRLRGQPGRRRLLRPEDRPAHDRLARALLAAGHGPARLLDAGALRPRLHRRRQRRAPPGDDPPRAARLLRALHRHPDRALRGRAARCGWRRCRRSCCRSPTASTSTAPPCSSALRDAGLRVELDERSESVGRKIRDAELRRIPYMLVVGEREAARRARSRCASTAPATRGAGGRVAPSSPSAIRAATASLSALQSPSPLACGRDCAELTRTARRLRLAADSLRRRRRPDTAQSA